MMRGSRCAALCGFLLLAGNPAGAADPAALKGLTGAPFVLYRLSPEAQSCGLTDQTIVPETTLAILHGGGFRLPLPEATPDGTAAIKYYLNISDEVITGSGLCLGRVGFSLVAALQVNLEHAGQMVAVKGPLWEAATLMLWPQGQFIRQRAAAVDALAKTFLEAWKAANQTP